MADNKSFYTLTALDTVPASTAGTGNLVATAGDPIITGTALNELNIGDFVVSFTLGEIRRVEDVTSATKAKIRNPFSGNVNEALKFVKKEAAEVLYMELTAQADTTINLNGNLRSGVTVAFGKPNLMGNSKQLVVPKIVNGATAEVDVNLEYLDSFTPETL